MNGLHLRKRIKNSLRITCSSVDLTTVNDIEFYIRQAGLFFQYTPEVISDDEMLVEIPLEDARQLSSLCCELQFAFTDEDGNPRASEIKSVSVGDLLKEAGYGSV